MVNLYLKLKQPPVGIIYFILAAVFGLLLPVLLIPIVHITGYSEIVEEVAKAVVIYFLVIKLSGHKLQIIAAILLGLLFGLSENFLYLNQIIQFGDLSVFIARCIWTVPMHVITSLIITLSLIAGHMYFLFGLIGSIILHSIFNIIALGLVK